MFYEITAPFKFVLTLITLVWFLAAVDHFVSGEMNYLFTLELALVALVWFLDAAIFLML